MDSATFFSTARKGDLFRLKRGDALKLRLRLPLEYDLERLAGPNFSPGDFDLFLGGSLDGPRGDFDLLVSEEDRLIGDFERLTGDLENLGGERLGGNSNKSFGGGDLLRLLDLDLLNGDFERRKGEFLLGGRYLGDLERLGDLLDSRGDKGLRLYVLSGDISLLRGNGESGFRKNGDLERRLGDLYHGDGDLLP